jgi:peptidoglycan/LPS O-acetylase OafA/YrhL
MEKTPQKFVPALEGVRGYSFLMVFLIHYLSPAGRPVHGWAYPWFLFTSTGWMAVSVFFAISGYLITGILYRSKGLGGFFKVFYGRRFLRVFPLYYGVLVLLYLAAVVRYPGWNAHFFYYFAYLQNWSRSAIGVGPEIPFRSQVNIDHFWSLAVEEQFYLFWPLAIWVCRNRQSMLRLCYAVLVGSFAVRLAWPLLQTFHVPMAAGYFATPTRVDCIVCGAVVALLKEKAEIPKVFTKVSYWVAGCGLAALCWRAFVTGSSVPDEYFNIAVMTPIANLISVSVLLLVLREETWVSRACRWRWVRKVGQLSYGLYVLHFLYLHFFTVTLPAKLDARLGSVGAQIVGAVAAFSLSWLLASLSYRYVEQPALRAKRFLHYTEPVAKPAVPQTAIGTPAVGPMVRF